MMLKERLYIYNVLIIILAAVESILVFLIAFIGLDGRPSQKVFSYVIAAGFWGSIIAECVLVFLATKERRKAEQQKYRNRVISRSKPGVLSFFATREGAITDMIVFISIVVAVVIFFIKVSSPLIITGVVAVAILTLNLHCILNGKNYRYMKAFIQYKKEHESDG